MQNRPMWPSNPAERQGDFAHAINPLESITWVLIATVLRYGTRARDRVRKIALEIVPGRSASQAILRTLRSFDGLIGC